MSESQSGVPCLPDLSTEDLKDLQKRAAKAKRHEELAKRKQTPYMPTANLPLTSSVVFGNPVKITYEDDKLRHALGEFEDATHFLHHGEVIGVERQPATPLPSDKRHRNRFMPAPSPLSGDKRKESSSHIAHRQENRDDTGQRASFDDRIKAHESAKNVSKDSNSANASSNSGSVTSNRPEQPKSAPHSVHSNLNHKQPSSSSQPRVSKPDLSHSSKHVSSVVSREPVLESFNQQLSVSLKKELPSSIASKPVLSTSNQSSEQNSRSSSDVRSVLSEKEANRTVNGVRKPRPQLHIPETVEDIFQEFDLPQPVTAINTPFKDGKTIKFPFKNLLESNDQVVSKDLFNKTSESGRVEAPHSSEAAPIISSSQASRNMEEIADKDPSSSSSDASDDDDDDVDDDGSGSSSGSESEAEDQEGHSDHDRSSLEQKVKTEISSQQQSSSAPASMLRHTPLGGYRAPDKTQQMDTYDHKSSSDSSSSDSGDSSDSGSDSDSEPEQDGQRQATPLEAEPTSSPSSQSRRTWELENFLPKVNQTIIGINAKPPSYEAPASNKSEDHFDGDKRSADHVSDENPPSNDHDGLSKRMSADEFSPPVPLDKVPVLSPIKSPIMRMNRHSSAAEKVIPKDESVNYSNKYDSIKQRERKSSQSMPSPDVSLSDKEKSRKPRPRKPRTKPPKSQAYVSDSDSDVDALSTTQSQTRVTPKKSCGDKSQITSTNLHTEECPNSVLTSPSLRRDGQTDRHIKQQDRIKLKPEYSLVVPEKLNDCDISKPASKSSSRNIKDPSVDQILGSFPGATPLSPLPNNPNVDISPSSHKKLVEAGLATTPIKPLHGNISWGKGSPSLPVRIDLKRLERVMCVNSQSPHFLSLISPEKPPKDISAKSPLPNDINQPQKVLKNIPDRSLQLPNSALNRTSRSGDSEHSKSANSSFKSVIKPDLSKSDRNKQLESADNTGVPDFDSLPIRETSAPDPGSDDSSDSDSVSTISGSSDGTSSDSAGDSDSDMEANTKNADHKSSFSSTHEANTSSQLLNQSQPDVRKRKIESSPVEDVHVKRRKTVSSSPHSSPLKQTTPVQTSEPAPLESVARGASKTPPTLKRERLGSASSQRSTQSNVSHASQRSKRPNVTPTSPTRTPSVPPASNPKDLKPAVTGERGSSSSQNSSRCEPPQQNGVATPVRASRTGYSLIENRDENERLMTIDEYHKKARKYKYQADDMKPSSQKLCLTKHILYIESALCFIQSGYASERSKKDTDAAKMYKDTQVFVQYRYSQCEADARRNSSNPERPETKLAVLCQRIQSFLFMKMYSLKKAETLKLKKILEEQQSKGVIVATQPNPPPAPSPHQQNWNRSTGTPSPMSPQPSPASVCSVGSVGSDQTPSKLSNGTCAGGQVPPGSVLVSQRIHSITQKYFSNTNCLLQAHQHWEQSDEKITDEIKDFFINLDHEVGPLTLHSSMQHMVKYVRLGLNRLHESMR